MSDHPDDDFLREEQESAEWNWANELRRDQQGTSPWDLEAEPSIGNPWVPVTISGAILVFVGALWLLNWILRGALEGWRAFPRSVASAGGAFATSLAVLVVAFAFYLLRQHVLALYAAVELAVAAVTAYRSSLLVISSSSDRLQWLLALMASVYIGVRGYDNLITAIRLQRGRVA